MAQKPEAPLGTGACAGDCASGTGAGRPRSDSLYLRASSSTAAARQISASQPEAVCRKLWRSRHSPPALSAATVSLHDGRLEVDARYAIANTAEAVIAFVKVGALLNVSFISRT